MFFFPSDDLWYHFVILKKQQQQLLLRLHWYPLWEQSCFSIMQIFFPFFSVVPRQIFYSFLHIGFGHFSCNLFLDISCFVCFLLWMGSLNYTLISPPTHSPHQSVRKYWQFFLHLKYTAKLRVCPCRHPTSISSHLGGRFLSSHPYFLPSILYIAARVNFSRQHWMTSLILTRKPVLQWRPVAIKISSMSEGVLRAPALSPFLTMLLYTVSQTPGALCLQLLPLPPLAFPSLALCMTGFFSFFTCQLTFHLTGDTFPGHCP